MMLPSILEKISYGIALILLHQQQRIPSSSFRIGMVDLIFAVLFTISSIRTRGLVLRVKACELAPSAHRRKTPKRVDGPSHVENPFAMVWLYASI